MRCVQYMASDIFKKGHILNNVRQCFFVMPNDFLERHRTIGRIRRNVMNIREQLSELIEKYDLINRTYEYFWKNYDSYLKEEPEEANSLDLMDRSSIEKPLLRYANYKLTSVNGQNDFGFELLSVGLDFYHKEEGGCALGYYTCEFTMNGEVFDDFFVIN